jgi:hypothetical protein
VPTGVRGNAASALSDHCSPALAAVIQRNAIQLNLVRVRRRARRVFGGYPLPLLPVSTRYARAEAAGSAGLLA